MKKYEIRLLVRFDKQLRRYFRKDKELASTVEQTLDLMSKDPFHRKLCTHKVSNFRFGGVYSSRVTGDIRIIWDFDEKDKTVVLALEVGGHDIVYR